MRSCAFVTLGCKVNQYETEAVREEILALGLEEISPEEPADLYVVNTCSVTGTSGSKSRRAVLRLARRNPSSRIVVMGCSSKAERGLLSKIPQVAVVVGNQEKGMVSSIVEAGLTGRRTDRPPDPVTRGVMELQIQSFQSRTRAYIKVQDGCNEFCSFCIIPHLRGRSRSRPKNLVLDELRRLAASGYREVVLTGIHLEDYGADLVPQGNLRDLLREFAGVARDEGVWRIRLSSLGPRAFTRDLVDLLRDPLFCPHWHIPLQSGDDDVLKRMRRGYTVRQFRTALDSLRETFQRPSITTDVLLGHPGETEEGFRKTLAICEEAGFSKIHIFPFSPREGTRSAKLNGRVPREEITRRIRKLRFLERSLALEYKNQFIGEVVEILVEGTGMKGSGNRDPDRVEGYTDRYLKVQAPAERPGNLENSLQWILVDRVQPEMMEGTLETEAEELIPGGRS